MKITCIKYRFADSTELPEVNYFSEASETTRDGIELMPYLMENGLSEITYPKNKVDENNIVFIESGDVSLNLTNTLQGYGDLNNYLNLTEVLLTDFFGFYTPEKSIFKVEIFDNDDDSLFTGIFRKYDIVFSDRTNEILSINIKGLDKEFAEYYESKRLIPFDEMFNVAYTNVNFTGLKFSPLKEVLKKNFPKVLFDFEAVSDHFIHMYIVAGKPYIYHPFTYMPLSNANNVLTLKTGYECFYEDATLKYDYFNSLIMSMGWKWSFKNGVMVIEKRADTSKSNYVIDYSDVLSHSVENELSQIIDSVIIDNGQYYGVNNNEIQEDPNAMNIYSSDSQKYHYLGGQSKAVYSNGDYNNTEKPYASFNLIGTSYFRTFLNWRFTTEKAGDSKDTSLRLRHFFGLNEFGYLYQFQSYNYDLNKTIYFKPRIPSFYNSGALDTANARPILNINPAYVYGNGNFLRKDFAGNEHTIYFEGNPGSSMLKINTFLTSYEPYDYYIQTNEFKNNLKTLTNDADSSIINITVNGLIKDFDKNFMISGYPYANYTSKVFTFTEISYDVLGNKTKLKLISIN